MVTLWHLTHLPVRVTGQAKPWTIVDEVVVGWPDRKVTGFLLNSGPFRVLFLPVRSGVALTTTGLEMNHRTLVERKSRKWRHRVIHDVPRLKRRAVCDETGQLVGTVKDLVIDEKNMSIVELLVSRGLMEDLLTGGLRVPIDDVEEDGTGPIKIKKAGHSIPGNRML